MFNKVDLSVYPYTIAPPKKVVITIGDLHASPMLLLYFLKYYGVIDLHQSQYEEMFDVYQQIGSLQADPQDLFNSQPLSEQHLALYERFISLIQQIKVNPIELKIRFLGDELGDRGECDFFIIKILEKLHHHQVKFSILISNHGLAFMACLQYLHLNKHQALEEMMIDSQSMRSYVYLRKLIDAQWLSYEYLERFMEEIYYPHLELLDYGLSIDGDDINLYTHAGTNLLDLQKLAEDYGVIWQASTIYDLAATLDQIKSIFKTTKLREIVLTLREIYQIDDSDERFKVSQNKLVNKPFWSLIWNRQYSDISPYQANGDYFVHNVHGHDECCPKSYKYYVSLDSPLGKCFVPLDKTRLFTLNYSYYKTLCRQEFSLAEYHQKPQYTPPSLLSIMSMYALPSLNMKNCLLMGGFIYLFRNPLSTYLGLPFLQNIFNSLFISNKETPKLLKN
jgi:hypothetical protein